MLQELFYLGLAGALGTLARYALSGLVGRWATGAVPWGTLAVNVVGCFLAGVLWAAFESRMHLSGEVRAIVLLGFMGAFTTFSSFVAETGALVRDAQWVWAAGNVLLHNGAGGAAFFLGLALGFLL